MKGIYSIIFLIFIVACSSRAPQQAVVIDLNGITQIMDAQPDKVQVINFWATWCKPCVDELPAFEKLQSNYGDQVEVILISLDDVENLESKVNPFLATHSIQSQVKLLDHPYAAEYIPLVDEHWDGAIPVTLFKYKNESKFFNKEFDFNELEQEVETLLKK
ncbi:MAG: TlpA disulfide reductase family protein [Nonlabens sp.]|uniref:TlpA disulfide reductase family protein n=1 Tax=Nonlabens sp. TaxID=1888209 RepID=UPI003EF0BAC9